MRKYYRQIITTQTRNKVLIYYREQYELSELENPDIWVVLEDLKLHSALIKIDFPRAKI